MERPIHILFAAPRDRYGDLLMRLQGRYAVHQARDDEAVIEFADQARAAGRPYDLAILAYEPPVLGGAATIEQLRVVAPTTPLLTLLPPHIPPPVGPLAEGSRHLTEPVDPATALGLVEDVLEERAAQVARLRSAVVAPLAGLSDEVLRQPDLVSALRALYQQLAGLVRADYFYVALYDRRRTRVLVPLTWDRGSYHSGAPRRHQAHAGLSDWVMAHDTPLVSGNLPTDAARRGWPTTEPGAPEVPTSVMVLPLRLGGQVIGVLGAFRPRPGAFTQEDYQVVSFVADFMAGVIGHWWRRQSEHEHQVLQTLDRHLGTAADRTAVLAQTAEAALQLTGMAAATMIGFDPTGTLVEQVVMPPDTAFAAFTPSLAQLAHHLSHAQPGGMVDYTTTTRTLADLGQRGVGRVVSYALSNDGRADALLWLLHGNERPFDDQDQAALAAVARHGRVALAEQTREAERTREQQVFARLAWRASIESSPTLLLSTAFTEIGKLVPWQAAAVWQADSVLGVLHPLRIEGPLATLPAQPLPLQGSPLDVALEQGGIQRLAPSLIDPPQGRATGPALAVSLQRSQAQAIGVLVLERAPGAPDFSLREEAHLLNLAQLLVAGLERLRWQRLGALHKALAGALEHPAPAVWSHVVGVVAVHLGNETTAALVLDGPELRPLAVFAPPDEETVAPWIVAGPLLRAAMAPGATTQVYSGPEIAPLGSLVVTPLVMGTTILGVFVAWSSRIGVFGAAALELLTQAAERVGPLVLVAQAGAGGTAQRRALNLFQSLHRDALTAPDVSALLRLVLMHALASTPATYGALFLREAGDVIKQRAEYPAQPGQATPHEIQALVAQVTRTGQMAQQSTADHATTLACVPLREGRASIGALLAVSPRPDGFTPDDLDLLTQLAALAADFITSRQSLEAGQALRSVAGLSVPTSRVLARLPALICQALNVPVCLVHVLDRRLNHYRLAGSAGLTPAEVAPGTATLALAAEDPAVQRFFAAAGRLVSGDGVGGDLWAPAELRAAGLQLGTAQPFLLDGRPFGILSVHTFDGRPLDVAVPRMLAALAAELGGTLDGLQQERRLGLLQAGSAALPHLPPGLNDPPPLPWPTTALAMLLDRIIGHIAQVTDAGGVYLLLRTDDGGVALHAAAGGPVPAPLPAGIESLLHGTEPRHLPDLRLVPGTHQPTFDSATRSILVLPLTLHDAGGTPASPLGVLLLESPTPLAFSPDDVRVLRAQAGLLTSLLFQHGLAAQWLLQAQQAGDLLGALPALTAETDEFRLYHQLVGQARETLGADLIVLFPAGAPTPEVPPQSGNQGPGAVAGSAAVQGLVRRVLDTAHQHPDPYFVADVAAQTANEATDWLQAEGIRTMAFAPLLANGVEVGVLFAGWRRTLALDSARRQAVSLVAVLAASVLGATREQIRLTTAIQGQMQSLSMAAHELREPLDKVHMIIETALNGLWLPMSDELRGRLSVAYTLLDNHYELLNRVMQLDQLRTGQQALARVPVALNALVQDVLSRYADAARRADVQLQMMVDPLLVPQRALLDPVLLSLALGNLVQNGIKFTPAGGRVAVGCALSYTSGRELVFTVDDTGLGIPGDQATAIFAPYYQVDRSLGRETRGLGLGLPIARLVAELHGGTLTVESRLHHGSRFTLRVPFQPAEMKYDA